MDQPLLRCNLCVCVSGQGLRVHTPGGDAEGGEDNAWGFWHSSQGCKEETRHRVAQPGAQTRQTIAKMCVVIVCLYANKNQSTKWGYFAGVVRRQVVWWCVGNVFAGVCQV